MPIVESTRVRIASYSACAASSCTPPSSSTTSRSGTAPFAGASGVRGYARHWTPVHLDFAVDDIEVALRRAEAAGATNEGGIRQHAWGKLARLSDPFGHGLCLVQFTERGYDVLETECRERGGSCRWGELEAPPESLRNEQGCAYARRLAAELDALPAERLLDKDLRH